MSTNTNTKTATVLPEGIDAATHSLAVASKDVLSDVLTKATKAGNAVILREFGADADTKRDPRAAVKLALAVAVDMAGGTKARGETRQNVIAVRAMLDTLPDTAPLSAKALVIAARVRLDRLAADKVAKRTAEKALTAKVSDRDATPAERAAALETIIGIDAANADAKRVAALATLTKALESAAKAGVSHADATKALASAFAVKSGSTK